MAKTRAPRPLELYCGPKRMFCTHIKVIILLETIVIIKQRFRIRSMSTQQLFICSLYKMSLCDLNAVISKRRKMRSRHFARMFLPLCTTHGAKDSYFPCAQKKLYCFKKVLFFLGHPVYIHSVQKGRFLRFVLNRF